MDERPATTFDTDLWDWPRASTSRWAVDRRAQLLGGRVGNDPNPFRNPPPGYEAGLARRAVDDVVASVLDGKHVVVSGSHGSGKVRVVEEFYERCVFAGAETIVTSPAVISCAKVPSQNAADVAALLHAAALGLVTFIEMPSRGARAASDAIRSLTLHGSRRGTGKSVQPPSLEAVKHFVDALLTELSVVAVESDRALVLRLRDGDKLSRQQIDVLLHAMAIADERCPAVRLVVSGLPSLTTSMSSRLEHAHLRVAANEVALDWRIGAPEEAVDYIVNLTMHTDAPFTEKAAQQLVVESEGLKSLINVIGIAAWDFAMEHQLGEVRQSTVRMIAPQVVASMRAKYERALELLAAGHPAARYAKALYDLTTETGNTLHDDSDVLARAGMTPAQGPTARHRKELRAQGFTMRSIDGKVGLADPHLGLVMEHLVPNAAKALS